MNHPACTRVGIGFACAAAILAVAHAPASVPTNARQPLGPSDIAPTPENQAPLGGRSRNRVIGGRLYRVSFAVSGRRSHPPALIIPRDTATWFASHVGRVGTMLPAATGSPVSALAAERALNAATGHGDFASNVTLGLRWLASEVHRFEYMGLPTGGGRQLPPPGPGVLYVPTQERRVIVVQRPTPQPSEQAGGQQQPAEKKATPAKPTFDPRPPVDPESLVFISDRR